MKPHNHIGPFYIATKGQWCWANFWVCPLFCAQTEFVLCTDSIGKFKRCSQFVTVCLLLCLAFWCITSSSSFCCKTFSRWRLFRFHSCLCHIQPTTRCECHRSTHSPMTGWMGGQGPIMFHQDTAAAQDVLFGFISSGLLPPLTFYGCIKDTGQQVQGSGKKWALVKHFSLIPRLEMRKRNPFDKCKT